MRIRPWANGRGCDVGMTEVHYGEHLSVWHHTEGGRVKHLTAPASMDVLEAVRQCRARGERVR